MKDISVVNNYRSQFNRVIAQSSFEDLVRIMKEKQPQGSRKVAVESCPQDAARGES